jgi:hypothetical protein
MGGKESICNGRRCLPGLMIWVVRTVVLLVSIKLRQRRMHNCRKRAPVNVMHYFDIVGDNHLMG